jgi:hypothetical protein
MSKLHQRWFFFVPLLLSAALFAGCGQKELPKSQLYPARGKVMINGEPARYVIVHLSPVGGKGGEAHGVTGNDGTFELRTYSQEGPDGALPGEYTVEIEGYDPVQAIGVTRLPDGAKPTKVPKGLDTSKITVEIVEGEDNDLLINIP